MRKAKKQIDWLGIERDYVKTDLSIREIARWYGCSDRAIRLRAKAGGWARPGAEPPQASPRGPQPLSEVVEPIVERVRTPLNSDTTKPEAIIGRGRILALRMLDELDATNSDIGKMEEAIEDATPGKSGMRRRETMMKAVSLPVRAGTLKNLALAVKTLAETLAPAGKKAAAAEEARIAGRVPTGVTISRRRMPGRTDGALEYGLPRLGGANPRRAHPGAGPAALSG